VSDVLDGTAPRLDSESEPEPEEHAEHAEHAEHTRTDGMPVAQHARRRHYCPIAHELRMRSYRDEPRLRDDPSWTTRPDEVPEPCPTCEAAWARSEALAKGRVLPFYVVCYAVDRRYGGPEEGGWYYDRLQILEVHKVYSFRGGLYAAHLLKEAHPTCRYGRGSVLGGDDVYVRCCYDESDLPAEFTERPRYE
jgi:hypothetical protein